MKTVSVDTAAKLLDFAASADGFQPGFAQSQLEGAVAAHNMLALNGVSYLADEVGLGKTYVALGAMGLLRHQNPDAKILVIAPRENIQRKWIKEQANFVRSNWRVTDGRVKSLQGGPARAAVFCPALRDFARELTLDDHRDFFLRMTAFSLAVKESEARDKIRKQLQKALPWVGRRDVPITSAESFLDGYGRVLNRVLPEIDLLVVDEAHNLKHGLPTGRQGSVRNRLLARILGHPALASDDDPEYRPKVKRLLLLSATPFENDYGAIRRQVDLLGHSHARLQRPDAPGTLPLRLLGDGETKEEVQRGVLSRMMLRRIAHLRIDGEKWTKNMYRREWRSGGYFQHDEPIEVDDPRQRLVVGLMQKKVSEVLQDERFQNSYQIGMLSSFESFLESVAHRRRREDEAEFEGQQETRRVERRGIDTDALGDVVRSHRRQFGTGLPHPKLDLTAEALQDVFTTGEKALVFVRRVATVRELGDKLARHCDQWLRARMEEALPELGGEIDELFKRYESERRRLETAPSSSAEGGNGGATSGEGLVYEPEDEGGADSFFAWFFRGEGPEGVLSGAAFQKNRLSGTGSAYSILLEDDWVSWLLGRPDKPMAVMAERLGLDESELESQLRQRAWEWFRGRSGQQKRYPRLHVFEGYQAAALQLLSDLDGELGRRAQIMLQQRFPAVQRDASRAPDGFPGPRPSIGLRTVFTELERRPALCQTLWPDEMEEDFLLGFRRREMRRELLSAMARLGAPYVDLYMEAIRQIGGFELRRPAEGGASVDGLIDAWLDHLEAQNGKPGFHGYRELAEAAAAFDTLISVNFHEAHERKLWELPALFGATLQRQVPVGAMSGAVNHRLVRQFRMPGFPLVLVTTDVLQEGEDLHTFCRRVIHYGINWTPSAMEQRTGRVDRVGSLLQRRADGREGDFDDAEKIQVHYPHLRDTVEVLQVRRVLQRMNQFLRLIHEHGPARESHDSRMHVDHELLDTSRIERISEPLESAFPVREHWLGAQAPPWPIVELAADELFRHLQRMWARLVESHDLDAWRTSRPWTREGVLWLGEGGAPLARDGGRDRRLRQQHFRLELHPGRSGGRTYLLCQSRIGEFDLRQGEVVDSLYDLQWKLGMAKLAARPVGRRATEMLSVERSMLFGVQTTQYEEVEGLVRRVVQRADRFEAELLQADVDPRKLITAEDEDDA